MDQGLPEGFQLDQEAPQPQIEGGGELPEGFQLDEEKYGGTGEQIKAGAEALGRGFLGPLAPLAEKALGVKEEDIRGRQEANPVTAGLGEAVGLGAGLLTGTGEAALMTKAGAAAVKAAGLGEVAKGASLSYRIGSEALKQATEMAVLQTGDELTKKVLHDPGASAETAIPNIGLAAVLGGGGGALWAGAVSPLWKATQGKIVEPGLKGIQSWFGKAEQSAAENVVEKSGLNLPPPLQAVGNDVPGAAGHHANVMNAETMVGKGYQKQVAKAESDATENILGNLGTKSGDLDKMELNRANTGEKFGETVTEDFTPEHKDLTDRYDKFNKRNGNTAPKESDYRSLADEVSAKGEELAWNAAPKTSPEIPKMVENFMDDLGNATTAEQIKKQITSLMNTHRSNPITSGAASELAAMARKFHEKTIENGILSRGERILQHGVEGPGSVELQQQAQKEIAEYNQLRGDYRDYMKKLEDFDKHTQVGRWETPRGYFKALAEKARLNPEKLADAIGNANKSNILEQLQQNLPKTLEAARQYHIEKLLDKNYKNGALDIHKLVKNLTEDISPQLRDFILSKPQQEQISAVATVLQRLQNKETHQGLFRKAMEALSHKYPSAAAFAVGLASHSVEIPIIAHLAKVAFGEGSDATRIAMLKYMNSGMPIKAEGLKSAVDYIAKVARGQAMLNKATAAVLKPGAQVVASYPTSNDREKLQNALDKVQNNPDKLIAGEDGHLGHYMPESQSAIAQTATQAANYLNSIRPKPFRAGPLDKEIEPSQDAMAKYNRAMDIAINPTIVLDHIKEGTLQPTDIAHLHAMYPSLQKQFTTNLLDQVTNMHANDQDVPYKTRMSISLFLGQPLDSSMKPESIIAAQPKPRPSMQQPGGMGKPKRGTASLGKAPNAYKTTSQAAEGDRSSRD